MHNFENDLPVSFEVEIAFKQNFLLLDAWALCVHVHRDFLDAAFATETQNKKH